jgi:Phage-related minor tail protein
MAGIPLIYEIGAEIGPQLKRAVRGVESEMKASNSRIAAETRRASTARMTSDPMARQAARGFDQIGRAARAADAKIIRERMSADKKASAERLKQIADEERAAIRAAEKVAATQERASRRMASGVAKSVGGSVKKVAGIGANALALGGGLLGGMAATNAVESEIALQHAQRDILRNARGPGQADVMSPEDLRKRVTGTAVATGASREAITGGIAEFVKKTGDLPTAVNNMETFSKVAMAAGADVQDVFAAAADLSKQFGIKDVNEMKQAFSDLVFQGKKGAFILKDMASTLPELSAAFSAMGGRGVGGVKELGGLAQIAKMGTGDPEVAKTALIDAFMEIVGHSKEIQSGKEFGRRVQVFEGGDPTKAMLGPSTVLANVIAASRGNAIELEKLFGRRGIKAVNPLIATYKRAAESTTGNDATKAEAGRSALIAMIADAANTGAKWNDVQADAQNALQDTSAQLQIAQTRFNDAVGTKLLPVLTELIPKFTDMIPKLANFVGAVADVAQFFINNPFLGIGAIVTGTIVKDLGEAAIGAAVRNALTALLAGTAAEGGLLAAAGKGVESAGGALAAKFGIGAGAATLGLAGAGAAVGVGAAAYEALGLKGDIEKSGTGDKEGTIADVWKLIKEGPARASTRDEYDRQHPPAPAKPAPGQMAPQGTALDGQKIGRDIGNAAGDAIAARIASASMATNAPSDRRTTALINRP